MHARPRVQRAPGIPCALCLEGKENERQTSGNSRREIAKPCLRKAAVCRAPVRNETTVLLEFETAPRWTLTRPRLLQVQKQRTKAGNRSAIRFPRACRNISRDKRSHRPWQHSACRRSCRPKVGRYRDEARGARADDDGRFARKLGKPVFLILPDGSVKR